MAGGFFKFLIKWKLESRVSTIGLVSRNMTNFHQWKGCWVYTKRQANKSTFIYFKLTIEGI